MKPKNTNAPRELFGGELAEILNHKHPLVILANKIYWSQFEKEIDSYYASDVGRPNVSTRLMVGLLYLKHAFRDD
jgi:transposase, IS5 family